MLQTILTTASESLAFLPALLCNLVFFTLTGWVLWFRLGGLLGQVRGRMTILLVVGLFGLVFVGFLSLGLAMAGWFSAVSFFGVWALSLAALTWDGWRRGLWKAHCDQWRLAQRLPVWTVPLFLLWMLLFARPFDLVTGGRDPGVYVNTAAQIAEQGGLAVADPFFADLDPATQDQLTWNPYWLGSFIPYKWPGFFWMGSASDRPGMVLPQFFHMYPALMAPSYAVLGYRGALTILPVIVLIFGLLLAELAWSLLQSRPGPREGSVTTLLSPRALEMGSLLPPLFLLLGPALYWFGRFANADVPYGLFVFAALFFWARVGGVRKPGMAQLAVGGAVLRGGAANQDRQPLLVARRGGYRADLPPGKTRSPQLGAMAGMGCRLYVLSGRGLRF